MTPEQEQAMQTRLAEDARRLILCDEVEALTSGLRARHPYGSLRGLTMYLAEPERSRLHALLDELNLLPNEETEIA